MCDRQNIRCQGCYGQAPTLWTVVLQCDVRVDGVSDRNTSKDGTAGFPDFRSWKFSKLSVPFASHMSTHEIDDFEEQQTDIRKSVKAMVAHINSRGGWTVIGWHRRGTKHTSDEAEEVLANKTAGHISYLMPTDLDDLDHEDCKPHDPAVCAAEAAAAEAAAAAAAAEAAAKAAAETAAEAAAKTAAVAAQAQDADDDADGDADDNVESLN